MPAPLSRRLMVQSPAGWAWGGGRVCTTLDAWKVCPRGCVFAHDSHLLLEQSSLLMRKWGFRVILLLAQSQVPSQYGFQTSGRFGSQTHGVPTAHRHSPPRCFGGPALREWGKEPEARAARMMARTQPCAGAGALKMLCMYVSCIVGEDTSPLIPAGVHGGCTIKMR